MKLLIALALLLTVNGIASANGSDIFKSNCVVCHGADAKGVPGIYPPLEESIGVYVAIPEGRAYLIHVVSFGMTGAISVHGQTYDGAMQPWAKFKDEDLAQVLNYVLATFNPKSLPKDFSPLTSDEVKKYRSTITALGNVRKEREALMKALAARQGRGS